MKYEKHITRLMLRENPDTLFVFGDNLDQIGFGGQAAEMRGEPNAVGIPTKRHPTMSRNAFFTDSDYRKVIPVISDIFDRLFDHVASGGAVVWPANGIGTGLADLQNKAPSIWKYIEGKRENLEAALRR